MMTRFLGLLRAYRRNDKGIAAVEFALIAPVLLLMMLGAVEAGRATVMARRFDLITHMVADLVTRETSVTVAGNLTPISQAVQLVWAPNSMATLKFQILQIRAANTGSTKKTAGTTYVDWGYGFFGAAVPAQCANYSMPNGMIANGNGMIVVNGTYTYTPLFASNPVFRSSNVASLNWTRSVTLSPRQTTCVYFNDTPYNQQNCSTVVCE